MKILQLRGRQNHFNSWSAKWDSAVHGGLPWLFPATNGKRQIGMPQRVPREPGIDKIRLIAIPPSIINTKDKKRRNTPEGEVNNFWPIDLRSIWIIKSCCRNWRHPGKYTSAGIEKIIIDTLSDKIKQRSSKNTSFPFIENHFVVSIICYHIRNQ